MILLQLISNCFFYLFYLYFLLSFYGRVRIKIQLLPEEKRGGLFLGRLPKPLLALAMLPAKEPLDTKSSRLVHLSDTVSSVVTPETPGTPGTASCVCFNDGDGL